MRKKAAESNVIWTKNGASITPQLHSYLSKKEGGHHVLIRVTVATKHTYLDTNIYVLPAAFNVATKTLRNAATNEQLRHLLREAMVEVELIPADKLTKERIKAAWVKFQAGEEHHNWLDEHHTVLANLSLDQLMAKRAELEIRLAELNDTIKHLAEETGRDIAKAVTTPQDIRDYESAVTLFKASLAGRKQRDINAFNSFFKVLAEWADVSNVELTLNLFDMKFYASFADYVLYTRDNYNNTFGAHIKKLKGFLNHAVGQGFAVNKGYKEREFKILEEKKKVVYITDDELDKLWNMKKHFPHNHRVIDLAVFQNLTGLRISDCRQKHGITEEEGERFLSSSATKNDGEYTIPLSIDERIEEILKTYEYDMEILSEAVFNRELKEMVHRLYEHYNLKEPNIVYYRFKLKERFRFEEPKSALLSSHSNRRGFITRHINSGDFDSSDVMKMVGSKDYKTMLRYLETDSKALNAKAEKSRDKRLKHGKVAA